MKATLTKINVALVLLTAAALLFLGYFYVQYSSFDTTSYEREAAELREQAETLREESRQRELALQQSGDGLFAELTGLGDVGAAPLAQLEALQADRETKAQCLAQAEQEATDAANIREVALAEREAFANAIRQLEDKINAGETDAKICYWTFDDGPSYNTQAIVDFCREHNAYVTFFTSKEANSTGAGDDPAVEKELLRNAFMGGNSIGNHTVSHQYAKYGNVYGMGIDSFRDVLQQQEDWVVECTGVKPDLFRFPGGSAHAFSLLNKEEMFAVLDELGYQWIDWSCDLCDNNKADPDVKTTNMIARHQIPTMKIAVMLSHDWNPSTAYTFQVVVPELQEKGYLFLPLFSQSWTIDNTTIMFP